MSGWIRTERAMCPRDHMAEFYGDLPLQGVWHLLLSWANWQDSKIRLRLQQKVLRRGQIATSIEEISKALGISSKTVRNRLQYLVERESIGLEKGNLGTLITILNYDRYQALENDEGKQRASSGQARGKLGATSKTKEQENKEQEDILGRPETGPTPTDLAQLWNEQATASGFRKVGSILSSTKRYRAAKARLADEPDLDAWRKRLARAGLSPLCRGEVPGRDGGSSWLATFDWFVRPDTGVKIDEGFYDPRHAGKKQLQVEDIYQQFERDTRDESA